MDVLADGGECDSLFSAYRTIGLVGVDAEGVISAWAGAAQHLLGYSADEAVGMPAERLLASADERATVQSVLERTVARAGATCVLALRHRAGREVCLGVWGCPLRDASGRQGWIALLTTVDDLRWRNVEGAVVDGLFSQGPIGLAVLDADLRYIALNAALEEIHGVPRSETLGQRMAEQFPAPDSAATEARLRTVLETGLPVTTEHRGRTPADPDHEHVWAISAFRLTDRTGRTLGVASSVLDISDEQRNRERLLLLDEASERIGTTLDVTRTAEELTEVAIPCVADYIAVDLLEGIARGEEYIPGPVGTGALLRRAAIRSVVADAPEASYPVGELITFPPESPQAQCMATGKSVLLPTLENTEEWLAHDPVRRDKMCAAGIHSVVIVPLRARDVTLGVVHFYRWQNPDAFDHDDLVIAEELAARAAVCLDNARLYTREHNAALTLQRRMLQGSLPEQTAVEAVCRYLPARAHAGIAGDWFDVISLSGARVALVVGDVPGRGVQAVAGAGRLRLAVHTLAQLDVPPDELLSQLDDMVSRAGSGQPDPDDLAEEIGTTCLYAIYDPVSRQCTVASAGHLPPVIVDPGGKAPSLDLNVGPPLGLGGLPFETADAELAEGSILALFTNGLTDGYRGDLTVGLERLREALSTRGRPLDEVIDAAVTALQPAHTPEDDAILLLARTRVLGEDSFASWDLQDDPAVVAESRTLATRQVQAWGLDEAAFEAELVTSELVTNAIRYGRAPIQLRLIRGRTLICEVSDASSTSPHLRHAADTDEGGRGLFMIAQIAERWGTRYTPRGKTIWAEFSP
ncbi:SpoIIE family protein phosphatase [Streptomyces sp. NPDC046805]|uniref:SpoIIE family protein phosphatase n=1 Tax=Streptomyces sp. NPDC046805 TaxID=3155134 RepID=UPI00340C9EE7